MKALRPFTNYASLTDDDRDAIVAKFNGYRDCTDAGHAAAITASDLFCTPRSWNSKKGGNVFAAVMTVLVMRKAITIAWPSASAELKVGA